MDDQVYQLHDDRLHTTDERGHRVYIHPEDLKGPWRSLRTYLYWALILIYMLLPWIHINGEQSILLNLSERKFTFFGNVFWGHEAPYLIFIFLGFAFAIALITSIWGRVWCGWACPQTVFLDAIFRKVEAWVEGKSRKRMKLDQAPLNLEKVLKKSLKWFLFTLISLHITHSFLGYFVGARKLFWITTSSPSEHPTLFITMLIINAIILFDFGWFREQFCIIMCPYGRFQSILMDSDSLLIAYDTKRGEPRKDIHSPQSEAGDCVNCYQCVKVCPTGIDIRRGSQLECIACTACIDACDNIMLRLDKPVGLIRYTSENELAGIKTPTIKPRTAIYGIILIALLTVSYISLKNSNEMRVILLKASTSPFSRRIENGKEFILNHYKADFLYKGDKEHKIKFTLPPKFRERGVKIITPKNPITIKKGRKKTAHLFIKFPKELLINGSYLLNILFQENNKTLITREVTLVGPY